MLQYKLGVQLSNFAVPSVKSMKFKDVRKFW